MQLRSAGSGISLKKDVELYMLRSMAKDIFLYLLVSLP